MQGLPIVVVVIIISNVLASITGFRNRLFFDKYKFQVAKIKAGEQIRMLTSGFLHVDFNHILFNMLSLYFFAGYVVYSLGSIKFLVVYFSSLYLGNYLSLRYHENQEDYTAVGASGAVSGIVYSAVLLYPDMKLAFLFFPIPLPGYVIATLYLIYTLYGMKRQQDNIGHTAHFGGAISGLCTTIAFQPNVISSSAFTLSILAATIVIAAYFFKKIN